MAAQSQGRRTERHADRMMGEHDESRRGYLTTEFWAMIGVIVATLIAAAIADNFDAPRAWWIVGVVATGYFISRGLAKSGTHHDRGPNRREDGRS